MASRQTNIYDWLEELPPTSNRLVKSDLKTLDYNVLDYLKKYALGRENKVSGATMASLFGYSNTANIRGHIKRLRVDPSVDVIIGSDNSGYWIPTEEEFIEAVQYKLNKAISECETVINMFPRAAKIIQAVSGLVYKKVDKASQGQTQIQFNGWEQEYINRYANKYINESKEDQNE